MLFLTIFIIIPLMEVFVFLTVGEEIGVLQTLLLCVLTAAIGGFLVKQQGIEALFRGQKSLQSGYLPVEELFDGFCLVVAGAMLITPGFVTDTIGFSLLFPPIRRLLQAFLVKRMKLDIETSARTDRYKSQSDVIEGNYERLDEDEEDDSRNQ